MSYTMNLTFDLWFNMEPWIFMQGGHFDEEFKIQEVCDPFHTVTIQ